MTGAHSYRISGRFYPIFTGEGMFRDLEDFIAGTFPSSRIFILTDENVRLHCLPLLLENSPASRSATMIAVPAGEGTKEISRVVEVWNWLAGHRAERKDLLINFGGGVVTDLGGFIAGTYKRGIAFINIPTTLIGQADASVGGKTGINVGSVKNQAGLFNHPAAVFIHPSFLKTLPDKELIAGYAEIIKSALIAGGEFWDKIKVPGLLKKIDIMALIRWSVQVKTGLADLDPIDLNQRRALNFGHTIGHALESLWMENNRKPLLHGEAVAAGMICETYLSVWVAGLDKGVEDLTEALIYKYFDPVEISENDLENLVEYIMQDKKIRDGFIHFPLITAPGQVRLDQQVPVSLIREAMVYYRKRSGK